MFGGLSTYLRKGEKQIVFSYRGFRSTKHYQGTEPFPALDANGPINRQSQINIDFTYALNSRWNLSVGVPFHFNDFAIRRADPLTRVPTWQNTNANGIGDITVRARYWLMTTEKDDHNIGLSIGMKAPTGKSNRTDEVFGRSVPVDISVQTGDSGWGITTGAQGFQRIKRATIFGSASYLLNPRNTSGVPTFFGSLNNPNNQQVNSVADQFATQAGVSVRVKNKWPVPSLAYRFEGVPVRDRIGKSDGFRRPGAFGFIEPGINYGIGKHLFSFSVGIRHYVNVKDQPSSARVEDATIPKYMFSAAYSVRLK